MKVTRDKKMKRSLINRICKCQATFLGHMMRREKLEHFVTTGMIEEKQCEKILDGLTYG